MSNPILLQTFKGTNQRIPVWFMRQAGRFLPQYRNIREKHSLDEMFQNPEIAAEVTCQPVDILKVDAAILFADILTLPAALGFNINFSKTSGPVVDNLIGSESDLKQLHDFAGLDYLEKTIRLTNQKLPKQIPLIGFAGSPFTVLTYLVDSSNSLNLTKTFALMAYDPATFHKLMEFLTQNTIRYLNFQKAAGIKAFQIFDTWAGALRPADYAHFVLPYVQKIFKEVDLPSIYYVKNCRHLLKLMDKTDADFLSVCHTVVLGHSKVLEKSTKGIQGNLFNGLLYADKEILEKEIRDVLLGAQHYKRYIFNLSHGIFPDTDVEKVKQVVEWVHEFKKT